MPLDSKICKANNICEVEKLFVDYIDSIDDRLEVETDKEAIAQLSRRKAIVNKVRKAYSDMRKSD